MLSGGKPISTCMCSYMYMYMYVGQVMYLFGTTTHACVRELVDSIRRDGADTPIKS